MPNTFVVYTNKTQRNTNTFNKSKQKGYEKQAHKVEPASSGLTLNLKCTPIPAWCNSLVTDTKALLFFLLFLLTQKWPQ